MQRRNAPILYLAWQDPRSRGWYPIGRLSEPEPGTYEFVYTHGFEVAREIGELEPLPAFPELARVYRAKTLFPMFHNRIMSSSREEYGAYLSRMKLPDAQDAPLTILARSLGRRSTDTFELFAFPLVERSDGTIAFSIHFFIHGIRHRPVSAQLRAERLTDGERLALRADEQNEEDPNAVWVTTDDGAELGFVPRYYAPDLRLLIEAGADILVRVEQVNPPPSPVQHRVLCSLEAPWRLDRSPFLGPEYRALPREARIAV